MASTTQTKRAPSSAVQNGNQTQPIAMTTISHHGNSFTNPSVSADSNDWKNAFAPRSAPRPPPPSSTVPRIAPPKNDYVPLCDPHFRLPWIELGIGLLCALLSLCLMIAGLSRGSVVGEESVKSRNYSAVYVGLFFLLVSIGLNVTFAIHFIRVRKKLKDRQLDRDCLTDSRPLNQGRQSYLADNLAFTGDESSQTASHAYPSQRNKGAQYSVSRGQKPNYNASQEKMNIVRQPVLQGSMNAELQIYGSSQQAQDRSAKIGEASSNHHSLQDSYTMKGMTSPMQARYPIGPQTQARGGAYGTGYLDQPRQTVLQGHQSAELQAYGTSQQAQARGMTGPVQARYPIVPESQSSVKAHGTGYQNPEKTNLARQSVPQGPTSRSQDPRAALRAYGSSQQAQVRGMRIGEAPPNYSGPPNLHVTRAETGLVQGDQLLDPQNQGRAGAYEASNPNQSSAVGFSLPPTAQEKAIHPNVSRMMTSSTGAMSNAHVRAAYGSNAAPPNARAGRPPPTYVGGSEHSSSPPSYRTYNNEPLSLSKPVAQTSMLSDAQQRDIIERRQQRLGEMRGPSSVKMKIDVHHH